MSANNDTHTMVTWVIALLALTFGLARLFYLWPTIQRTVGSSTVISLTAFKDWVPVIGALGALGALGAALAAWRGVAATRRSADAQLAKAFLDQYASPGWAASIRILEGFAKDHDVRVIEFRENSGLTVNEGSSEDNARREIHWFYKNAWHLYRQGLLSRRAMRVIAQTNGYEVFHDIAAPLSYNRDHLLHKEERWKWLDRMRRKFPPRGSRRIEEYVRRAWRSVYADKIAKQGDPNENPYGKA